MSVDINWETITSGPDGEALAESIRYFINEKFQQVALPRFIRSVEVHSFDFGKTCPQLEIKDIGDPLPDFYDEDGGVDEDESQEADGKCEFSSAASMNRDQGLGQSGQKQQQYNSSTQDEQQQQQQQQQQSSGHAGINYREGGEVNAVSLHDAASQSRATPPPHINTNTPPPTALRSPFNHLADQLASPFPRSGTPGIPGGTSNLSYFHLPMGGLSGTQTPLAAVASGTNLAAAAGWPPHLAHHYESLHQSHAAENDSASSTRPSTASTLLTQSPFFPDHSPSNPTLDPAVQLHPDTDTFPPPHRLSHPHSPTDLQIAFQISYTGDTQLTMTAEILLDYPMPSFVSIPLKLSITGLTFDGVGVLASIGRKLCFCFLGDEDAEMLLGRAESRAPPSGEAKDREKPASGGLLQEIKVESEIGRQENGKQVLKNVGKVERFVLEQVRRIFEDEFVWPSFWTVLI